MASPAGRRQTRGVHTDLAPTAERFRALARSSPWRWSTLEFDLAREDLEHAWIRRPDLLRVEGGDGRVHVTTGRDRPVAVAYGVDGGSPLARVWPTDVEPRYDADGLVAERPDDFAIDYDPPFHDDYFWVALLDPAELAEGVEVLSVDAVSHHGRPAWEARVRPTPEYDPRCACCALLSGNGELDPDPWVPTADSTVRLDVQTGVCVSVRHIGSGWCGQEAEMRIRAVDEPLADDLFRRPCWFSGRRRR